MLDKNGYQKGIERHIRFILLRSRSTKANNISVFIGFGYRLKEIAECQMVMGGVVYDSGGSAWCFRVRKTCSRKSSAMPVATQYGARSLPICRARGVTMSGEMNCPR